MMRTYLRLIAMALVMAISANMRAQGEDELNGVLFEISGNGLEKPSYLFGSIHVINGPSVFNFPHFREVWGKAERLVLETDLSARGDSLSAVRLKDYKYKNTPKQMSSVLLPDNMSYDSIIGTKAANEIDSVMRQFFPKYQKSMHPAYGSAILKALISMLMVERTATGNIIPIDGWLNDVAEKEGKEIDSLEWREFQDEMSIATKEYSTQVQNEFAELPLAQQMAIFHQECMKAGEDAKYMQLVKQYYKEGNGRKSVESILHVRDPKLSAIMQVDKRNRHWMSKIPDFMRDKTTLVIAGLAHLYPFFESKGLLHDLIEAGYTVRELK